MPWNLPKLELVQNKESSQSMCEDILGFSCRGVLFASSLISFIQKSYICACPKGFTHILVTKNSKLKPIIGGRKGRRREKESERDREQEREAEIETETEREEVR